MIKKMALPNPDPTNWTLLGVVWSTALAIVTIVFKWIDSSFAARKLEREAFIKAVVTEAMSPMNSRIDELFDLREKDRDNLDRKFEKIMVELKK